VPARIDRALDYLMRAQLASGQFPMAYSAHGGAPGTADSRPELSPFCTSHIAESLAFVADQRATLMIERSIQFLRAQMVRGGLWRYWCKDAPLHSQIPPDADDTACISDVLLRLGHQPVNNRDLLIANRNRDGLFYTWMVPRFDGALDARWWWIVLTDITVGRLFSFWHAGARRDDVDSVVNANVLRYLGLQAETARVVPWLREIAERGAEESSDRWYRSRAAFYHAVSRCHASGIAGLGDLSERMLVSFAAVTDRDGMIGSDALQTAMALCAMINFGVPLEGHEMSFQYLASSQMDDGGWGAYPIYHDGRAQPRISWSSREVTTAFCVEVMARARGMPA
jgi:hypothetical protein